MIDVSDNKNVFEVMRKLRAQQREYLEYAEEEALKGYVPAVCFHGTNLWTDYDNICGGCEEGRFTEHTGGWDLFRHASDVVENYKHRLARYDAQCRESARTFADAGVPKEKALELAQFTHERIKPNRAPWE